MGHSIIDGERYDWNQFDTLAVPGGCWVEHVNGSSTAPVILFGRRVRSLSRRSQDTLAEVGSYAGESLRHIKVVQAFNHQAVDEAVFGQRVEGAFAVAVRRIRQRAFLIALVMLLVLQGLARRGYHYELSGLDSGVEIRVNPLSRYAGQWGMPAPTAELTPNPARVGGDSPLRRLTA